MFKPFCTLYNSRWVALTLLLSWGCLSLPGAYAEPALSAAPAAAPTLPSSMPTHAPPALIPPPPPMQPAQRINDYPTQARIEYVFECMNRYGGQNFDNMYHCVCAIDRIAERIPYANYVTTATLATMSNTTGELGNFYREVQGGREVINEFKKFLAATETDCNLQPPKPAAAAK